MTAHGRVRARRLILPVCLLLVLTACPQAGPNGKATPSPSGPRKGGTLRVAIRDLSTLDPAKAQGRGTLGVVSEVFDSLTTIDPKTGKLLPAAAKRWSVSKNKRAWRFVLHERRYADGRSVFARDFKLAFDRIARKRTRSDAAFQLEQVRGFRQAHTTGTARGLSGVRARGHVLTITLERPFAELPYYLAHPALAPLHPRYAKSLRGLATRPVGNGPFRVRKMSPAETAQLVRNERYGGTQPYLDGIDYSVVRSLDEGWDLFNDGATDVADVPASAIATARSRYGEEGFTPVWAILAFGPNLKHRKYARPIVRRALSLAIDRGAIARTVYGETKDEATGIVPRGVRGFAEDACTVCETDIARARSIIKSAFGRRPPIIRIDHINDEASKQVAAALANDFRAVGLRARLQSYSSRSYFRLLSRGDHDFAELGWIADVPTPDGFLGQQLRTGSSNNQTGFKDTRFDRILDSARRMHNGPKRLALYRSAERRALALMPLIPIVFFRNRSAAADKVNGWVLDGAGLFDGTKVWLSA